MSGLVERQSHSEGLCLAPIGAKTTEGSTAGPKATGIEQKVSKNAKSTEWQIEDFIENLNGGLEYDIAEKTRKNYIYQWLRFSEWAVNKGINSLPVDATAIAAYLAERFDGLGHKPGTLYTVAAAIAYFHKVSGWDNPCDSPKVRFILKRATRMAGSLQRQADALTADSLAKILETACIPRRGRGGNIESSKAAILRGRLDIAMIRLMRDAMLRVSEAAVLKWGDATTLNDGSGRLLIRRSKTDAAGKGAVAFISLQTMEALELTRVGASDSDSIFGLRPNQISKRIKQAAQAAGLGNDYSGHSPRVGMARDLARAGVEMHSLMTAGRWSSPAMPALYIRNEAAGRGAVAQYYGHC